MMMAAAATVPAVELLASFVRSLDTFDVAFAQPLALDVRQKRPVLLPTSQAFLVVAFLRNVRTVRTLNAHMLEFLRAAQGLPFDTSVVPEGTRPALDEVLLQFAPLFALFSQFAESKEPFMELLHRHRKVCKELEAFILQREGEMDMTVTQAVDLPMQQLSALRDLTARLPQSPAIVEAREVLRATQRMLNEASAERCDSLLMRSIQEEWDMTGSGFTLFKAGRRPIKQGELIKVSRKKDSAYSFVLFNDCLIYGSSKSTLGGLLGKSKSKSRNCTKLHNVLALENMRVSVISIEGHNTKTLDEGSAMSLSVASMGSAALSTLAAVAGSEQDKLCFNVFMFGDKSFCVKASTPTELADWWLAIYKAITSLRTKTKLHHQSFSPVLDPDRLAKDCSRCGLPFSVSLRRHHCRLCGALCCNKCTRFRVSRPSTDPKRPSMAGLVRLGGSARSSVLPSSRAASMRAVRACQACAEAHEQLVLSSGAEEGVEEEEGDGSEGAHGGGEGALDDGQVDLPHIQVGELTGRRRVFAEILQTEQRYLDGIRTLRDLYTGPLLSDFRSGAMEIGGEVVRVVGTAALCSMLVFLSDVDFLVTLSERLFKTLRERFFASGPEAGGLAELFLRLTPLFQLYDEYSSAFDFALATMRRFETRSQAFRQFQEDQGIRHANRLARVGAQSLYSLLILPIQRLPRYILLLREAHKRSADDDPEKPKLARAADAVQCMTAHVNDKIQVREDLGELFELERQWTTPCITQGMNPVHGRKLLRQGTLVKLSRKSFQAYRFLLFDDVLLYGSFDEIKRRMRHHRTLRLEVCSVEVPSEGTENGMALLDVLGREKSFKVAAASIEERDAWAHELRCAIDKRQQQVVQAESVERAPIWQQDGPNCARCAVAFSVLRRRHHCRACGILVCNACSESRVVLTYVDSKRPQRVCVECATLRGVGAGDVLQVEQEAKGAKEEEEDEDEDEDEEQEAEQKEGEEVAANVQQSQEVGAGAKGEDDTASCTVAKRIALFNKLIAEQQSLNKAQS